MREVSTDGDNFQSTATISTEDQEQSRRVAAERMAGKLTTSNSRDFMWTYA